MTEEKTAAAALAEKYIKLRDARKKLKELYEAKDALLETEMNDISGNLLELCKEQDASSIKTTGGTIIRSITTQYDPGDWDAVYEVVKKYNAPYLLQKRIHNGAMKEFLDQHPEAFPVGMNVNNRYTITVRRPSKS